MNTEGWQHLGSTWRPRQAQSDLGVDMSKQMARGQEETKAGKQEQGDVEEQD